MHGVPPRSTRTSTLVPCTPLSRSLESEVSALRSDDASRPPPIDRPGRFRRRPGGHSPCPRSIPDEHLSRPPPPRRPLRRRPRPVAGLLHRRVRHGRRTSRTPGERPLPAPAPLGQPPQHPPVRVQRRRGPHSPPRHRPPPPTLATPTPPPSPL